MGKAEIITDKKGRKKVRFLRLVQTGPDGLPTHIDNIRLPIVRQNNIFGKPRHLHGSLLSTSEQEEEQYLTDNHIA